MIGAISLLVALALLVDVDGVALPLAVLLLVLSWLNLSL